MRGGDVSALEEYREYVTRVTAKWPDGMVSSVVFETADAAIAELEATIERLTWMRDEAVREWLTFAQSDWETNGNGVYDGTIVELLVTLEHRWQEHQAE